MKLFYFLLGCLFITVSNKAQTVTTYAGIFGGLFCNGTTNGATFWKPSGVCVDPNGNVYVADFNNHKIRKITPAGVVTTVAGSVLGYLDGTGTSAKFNNPTGVAVDNAGNLFVADSGNNRIRKITPGGIVSTFAGSTGGSADGLGTAANFSLPYGLCFDNAGNIYVADEGNNRIRKITAAGLVTTVAGSTYGYLDGTGTAAQFKNPTGVAVDNAGNLFVADSYNQRIRKITAAGVVTTFAGSGANGTADGTGTAAQFSYPTGICTDINNNLYVADYTNNLVRKITPAGVVTALAGGTAGFDYGIGYLVNFSNPNGVCVDSAGNVFVAEYNTNTIKKINTDNTVVNIAGSITGSAIDGTGTPIQFIATRVCSDLSGNVYELEPTKNRIRKITPSGVVTTFAGGAAGFLDGTGTAAKFNFPEDMCYDPISGNIYVSDTENHRIRKISPNGVVTTLAGSVAGYLDGNIAKFWGPKGICVDAAGNVYVADTSNFKIRKITPSGFVSTVGTYPGNSSVGTLIAAICIDSNGNIYLGDFDQYRVLKMTQAGVVSLFAGETAAYGDLDGVGTAARLTYPYAIAMGTDGNIYIVDGFKIKRITLSGVVTTIAGSVSGDVNGVGSAVRFSPTGLCFDPNGIMYIADEGNGKIKKMEGFALETVDYSSKDFGAKLYPSPTHDLMTIEINPLFLNSDISITDILGKKMGSEKITSTISPLDTSGYAKGIYFLTITNGTQRITQKFIKE